MIGRVGRLLGTTRVPTAVEVLTDVVALAVEGAHALIVAGHRRVIGPPAALETEEAA